MSKKINTEIGDTFGIPLRNGLYSVCRVIQKKIERGSPLYRGTSVLVAIADYFDVKPPDISEPKLRTIFELKNQGLLKCPFITWINECYILPESFVKIGEIPPVKEETDLDISSYSNWEGVLHQLLSEWYWEHDRERLNAK